MIAQFARFPLFVQIWLFYAIAMFAPAAFAWRLRLYEISRIFVESGLIMVTLGLLVGFILSTRKSRDDYRDHLAALLFTYLILPLALAMPIYTIVDGISLAEASYEMLSSMTTTGATLLKSGTGVAAPVFFWSALVAWMGGFTILLIAFAIMQPIAIGGFELLATLRSGGRGRRIGGAIKNSQRISYFFKALAPPYLILTAILTFALNTAGQRLYHSVVTAMSVISTSGLTPQSAGSTISPNIFGEILIALFLILALSHRFINEIARGRSVRGLHMDPELRLAAFLVLSISIFLTGRHIFLPTAEPVTPVDTLQAFWGAFFNALSFLTTNGMQSSHWLAAEHFSGLSTPGTIFLIITLIGGGMATTAGGVKLLRVFALLRLSKRELERMADPHSIAPAGHFGRRLRTEGAQISWVFLMLFVLGVSTACFLIALADIPFFEGLIIAISSAANCGPLLIIFPSHQIDPAQLSDYVLLVSGVTMIFGRVEVLVLVAIINPDFWLDR